MKKEYMMPQTAYVTFGADEVMTTAYLRLAVSSADPEVYTLD